MNLEKVVETPVIHGPAKRCRAVSSFRWEGFSFWTKRLQTGKVSKAVEISDKVRAYLL